MLEAGYGIEIKKILEFRQDNIFKKYIEDLYEMKKEYSLQNKKAMCFMVKIMLNSTYGSILLNKENYSDIRICTSKEQGMKYTLKPNFYSFKMINQNLVIDELAKNKVVYDSPLSTGSQVLFNSKCDLFEYMLKILPDLFSKENITFSFMDTASISYHLNNIPYQKYMEICNNHPEYFNNEMGGVKNEVNQNINEIIFLRSKSLSIQPLSDINRNPSHYMRKSKRINNNYRKRHHTHELYKKFLFDDIKQSKCQYYKIVNKNGQLYTQLET